MPQKNEEYWKKCFEYWLSADKHLNLNKVCTDAKQAEEKEDYETAIFIYDMARINAQLEFINENEDIDRELAYLELSNFYTVQAELMRKKALESVQDNKKRIINKMDKQCSKTEEDLEYLANTSPESREAVENLIIFRNYATGSENGKKQIRDDFEKNHKEWKKRYAK